MRKRTLLTGAAIAGLAAAGGGVATALGAGGESEGSAAGPSADKARAAALEITGGGTANSVERDSENGATWEVEVTEPDGRTVDVRLDADYGKVVVEGDSQRGDEDR
jgi:peptidase YpeB-like protein